MAFINWICEKWSVFWGKVFFIGALLFTVMIICWIIGWQCNLLIIGAFLLGLWAVNKVAKRINPKIDSKELAKNIYWYIAIFVCTAGFFLTFFKSSLLSMVIEWKTADIGIVGFAEVFMPIIVLTVASVALATVAKTRKFATIWLVFCLITSVFGLMGFRLIMPLDKFGGVKQVQLADELDASRIKMEKNLGLRAVVTNYQAVIYNNRSNHESLFEPLKDAKKFDYCEGTVLPVLNKDLVSSIGSTEKFVKVKIGGKIRWLNANDVSIVPAGDVNIRKGECAVVKDGNTLTVFCMSSEPFFVEFPKGWREVVAKYDKIILMDDDGGEFVSEDAPQIKLGSKFRPLPYMGMCGIRDKVFLQGRSPGDKIVFYNNQ